MPESFLPCSAGTTQVNPKKGRAGDTWLFFHERRKLEMGLKEKAVGLEDTKREALLETGYCKRECTEGKERVEGGQKEEMG